MRVGFGYMEVIVSGVLFERNKGKSSLIREKGKIGTGLWVCRNLKTVLFHREAQG